MAIKRSLLKRKSPENIAFFKWLDEKVDKYEREGGKIKNIKDLANRVIHDLYARERGDR